MRVLNVGGCSKHIAIPAHFDGWEHQLLDIVPGPDVDVVCDACEIKERLAEKGYDAVYCSHNLEHYYRHDIPKVLAGFLYALEDDGFLQVRVPDMGAVFKALADGRAIDEPLYQSDAGPITALDMIYGLGWQIEQSGCDFMCHKAGFTADLLGNTLFAAGFNQVFIGANGLELNAFAFKTKPTAYQVETLKLKNEKAPS